MGGLAGEMTASILTARRTPRRGSPVNQYFWGLAQLGIGAIRDRVSGLILLVCRWIDLNAVSQSLLERA